MTSDDRILSLIDTIYGAAVDEGLWPKVLQELTAATGSQAASLCILDSNEQPRLPIFEYVNFDPGFVKEYLDGMVPYDPNIQYLVAHPGERIYHDASFITEAEKDRHMYYDWHGRHSDTRHRLLGMLNPMPRVQSGVTLHRTRRAGDFDTDTIRRFTHLFRHIERALEIGLRLGTLGTMQQVSLDLLDRNPLAILLLDREGRIILANRAARRLGEERDGPTLAGAGIRLSRAADNRRLQHLIGEALRAAAGVGASPGGAMLAARPSRRPLSILVSPLAAEALALTRLRPAVCIVIADPEAQSLVAADRLRALFGLSLSESRLAARLAAGEDLRGAAAALGIGYPTARTQLAAIFRKTETRRQGELIMLLLKTVPLLASQPSAE